MIPTCRFPRALSRSPVLLLPPRVGVDVEDVAGLGEAVNEGGDAGGAGEDRAPLLEPEVGGDDGGALLMAATDDVEQVAAAGIGGQVAQFIKLCGAPHNEKDLIRRARAVVPSR